MNSYFKFTKTVFVSCKRIVGFNVEKNLSYNFMIEMQWKLDKKEILHFLIIHTTVKKEHLNLLSFTIFFFC